MPYIAAFQPQDRIMLCLNSNETPLIYANKRDAYKKVSVQIGNITKLQILQQT